MGPLLRGDASSPRLAPFVARRGELLLGLCPAARRPVNAFECAYAVALDWSPLQARLPWFLGAPGFATRRLGAPLLDVRALRARTPTPMALHPFLPPPLLHLLCYLGDALRAGLCVLRIKPRCASLDQRLQSLSHLRILEIHHLTSVRP